MKCPNCKDTSLSLAERAGIEIDYCPDCRGVWLDRGELDKILERSAKEREPAPEPQRSNEPLQSPFYGGGYGKPYKKKKSLLEELFD